METMSNEVGEQVEPSGGCIQCRLISGTGLVMASVYVAHHARKANQPYSKVIAGLFAAALGGVGCARLLGVPPFHRAGVITANVDSVS